MRKSLGAAGVLVALLLAPAAQGAVDDRATLERYAGATWASLAAMTDPESGLPTDVLGADGTRAAQTSTTNIGAYMWSAVAAERLGIIGHDQLVPRLERTLATLARMERHEPDGQFYNWYDHRTGEKLTTWPPTGEPLTPILSSVDNAWLATGLRIVRNAVPELSQRAGAIYDSMDFGLYYVPESNRILFHYVPSTGTGPCCYDTVVSESRIADYIGTAKGELPRKTYYGRWRSFPDSCDWSWQETRPSGFHRSYDGVDVFDGSYPYGATRLTPSWGGSMFEELMPTLFVPEERWAPGSWRQNHPLTVDAQIDHGLNVAGYGAWGFSPSNVPEGGYRAYGVDAIGMDPNGNPSNEDRTLVDRGFPGCAGREAQPDPPASAYTNGVVTPHAAFLALRYRSRETMDDLARLESIPGMFGKWGFADSVNMQSRVPSPAYLSLDQGMIMGALGNALGGDVLREAFATTDFRRAIRPVIGVEEFNVFPRGCTITGTTRDDKLAGTPGDDVICALGGDDVIDGGGGDDVLYGDAGDDRLAGGAGADTLYGDDGDDRLSGGDDEDVLAGGPGTDRLSGDAGADHAEGGGGEDRCRVNAGDDAPGGC
jgi:RTX calcium-binding nonapeptide repeat (4 copies)/Putative glucoamylase/Protein of unknown function (DUF3131)